mmetsp:Transcript_20921/g.29358  ORF Transcript_20921/g.29358 Transcript_20921/m.29358 type:complete len:229 (-) Transcript_20921:85-771(-)
MGRDFLLSFDNGTSSSFQDLALSSICLDSGFGCSAKGMGLDCDVLGRVFSPSYNDLVDGLVRFGDALTGEEGIEIARLSGSDSIEFIKFDDVVLGLGMSRTCGPSHKLGKTSVEWLLSSLKARTNIGSGSGFLSSHSETASGSLSGRNTTSLASARLARSWSRGDVVECENCVFHVVQRFAGGPILATLPVIDLHGKIVCVGNGGCVETIGPHKGRGSECFRSRGQNQ